MFTKSVCSLWVYKTTHCGKSTFVVKNDKGNTIVSSDHLETVGKDIRILNDSRKERSGQHELICRPKTDITIPVGKNPILNEALSPEEIKILFSHMHYPIQKKEHHVRAGCVAG